MGRDGLLTGSTTLNASVNRFCKADNSKPLIINTTALSEVKAINFVSDFAQLFSQSFHPISHGNLLVCHWKTGENSWHLQEFEFI